MTRATVPSRTPDPAPAPWIGDSGAAGLAAVCPLLATSATLYGAAATATVFSAALCASATCVSLCRRWVAPRLETAFMLLVAAVWVTVLDRLLQANAYPLSVKLGFYVPLMASNGLLLLVEERACCETPYATLRACGALALRVAALVIAAGALREILGAGGLFSDASAIAWGVPRIVMTPIRLPLLADAPGAFLALALLCAVINRLRPAHRVD